jgi:ACS family hexuronate transporter-like MFS transporter
MATSTFTTLGLGALAPDLRASFDLSTFEIGLLPGLVFLGALAASVPAGHLTDRIGAGRVLTISQLGVAGGVGVAVAASSRWWFLAGIAIAGLGYGAVNPATNVLSTSLVPRRRRALFLSVKQTGVTLGGLAAGAILPRLAERFGWRDAVGVAIAVLFAGALAGLWVSRREAGGWFEPPSAHAHAPEPESAPAVTVSIPGGGPTALFGFLMSGVQLSLAGYLTVYLVDTRGFSKTTAGLALSVAFAAACLARIAWGWVSDRFFTSHATTLVLVSTGSAAALVAIAAGVDGPSLWPVIVLIGACSIGWNGVYMALITDAAGYGGLGRATGRGLTAIYGGVAVLPPLFGVVRDVTHSWAAVWIVATCAVVVATAVLAFSQRRLVPVGAEDGPLAQGATGSPA